MDLKPVKHIKTPKYPLKTQISADAIKQHVPKRWAGSAAAKVALRMLAAMMLAGCGPGNGANPGEPLIPAITTEGSSAAPTVIEYLPEGSSVPAMLRVAPVFLHGEGRGAFGCVMVAPPVFLSEEDALAVINEAAKEYGLAFSSGDGPELTNVLAPEADLSLRPGGESGLTKPKDTLITLKTDFADTEHSIAIEYVSVDDVKGWAAPSKMTVEQYYTKDVADQLVDAFERAVPEGYGFYTIGVLYDPCEYSEPDGGEPAAGESRYERTRGQLKEQAKDFFEWLKSQRVI